eukprot:scaffold48075_cov39-Cyclotella_meneghiniana.AAC.3
MKMIGVNNYSLILHSLFLALTIHAALSRITTTSEKRALLLAEDASRLTRDESDVDDVSNVSQENTAPTTTTTSTTTTTTTTTSSTTITEKNMIQSLHELIRTQPHLTPTSDDPTSIRLSRRENINSFLDGMSVMNDNGPNPRDVSNAFGNRPRAMLNSFRA